MNIYKAHSEGIRKYIAENPHLTFKDQLRAIKEEFKEFIEEPSWNEFFDILHTCSRLIPIPELGFFVAYPTAKKLALRYINHGCVRSKRNCLATCNHERRK